ncbi:MAG: transcription termination factor Rho [Myxococcales bacterium]|nr:transcription termination factor Rho [Myxococcales bacterium]
MNLNELKNISLEELNKKAATEGVRATVPTDSTQLILEILRAHTKSGGSVSSSGTLEILGDGFGFLRGSKSDSSPSPQDIYVSPSQIRRFHLNTGDDVTGQVRPPKESERYFALLRVETINGLSADKATTSQGFSERTAMHAESRLAFAHDETASKVFDILCPIGKGQRVLLLAPPRSHGDSLLLTLAKAAQSHSSDYDLTSLVIGQRPEFSTEYAASVTGEVASSNFDEPAQRHTQITDVVLENAKRAADKGKDVLILVDSLSRLASAASQAAPGNGMALPGGLSPRGMQATRRLFGAGRNLVGAGSITVVALVRDSGSAVDDYLRQELTDAANVVVQLSGAAAAAGCVVPLAQDGFYNRDVSRFLTDSERESLAQARGPLVRASDAKSYHEALLSLQPAS